MTGSAMGRRLRAVLVDLVHRVGRENAFLVVGLFAFSVLVNGLLAVLFIALMQAIGLWAPAAEATALSDGSEAWQSAVETILQRAKPRSVVV